MKKKKLLKYAAIIFNVVGTEFKQWRRRRLERRKKLIHTLPLNFAIF